jgi:hypothetical protein
MKRRSFRVVVIAAFLAAALPLRPAENYKVVGHPGNFYFGHISYIEPAAEGADPVVLREGRAPEPAVLNVPIGPGDLVRTSSDRRLEIQFDTGTIVRLDFATEVKVETILARSLSSPQEISNLAVLSGRVYVMYKQYDRHEMFQILTENAAVRLRPHSVSIIKAAADGSSEIQVRSGRAHVLFGPDENLLKEQDVRKLERFVVQKDHQTQTASYISDTDFELWNEDINARFAELHKGLTSIPKPVQRLSPAVFHFAQKFGNRYGEWLWDDHLGYVWSPYIDNARYPWGWQPYYYGQWAYAGGRMFWVPQEPWGWVPYHLGIWHWNKKKGWVWIPGSLFAPAWVDWYFYFGSAAWRPWSVYDWIGGYGTPGFVYRDDGWVYHGPLSPTVISKDQLKKPAEAPFPIPRELRSVVKKVEAAYLRQDPLIIDSIREIPKHLVLVPRDKLNAREIHDKALTWDKIPKLDGIPAAESHPGTIRRPADSGLEALRLFRSLETPRSLPRRSGLPDERPAAAGAPVAVAEPGARPDPVLIKREGPPGRPDTEKPGPAPAVRFRDWNPDLKIARELGVRIEYSSLRNEVVCPDLNLSSRDRSGGTVFSAGPRLTPQGVSGTPGGQGGLSSPGASGTSTSTSATTRTGSERSTGSSERSAARGGEKETIKN